MIAFNHPERCGIIPHFFDEADPRPAAEQIEDRYSHGGGWSPIRRFKVVRKGESFVALYPGDPPFHEVARARLRDETLVLFQGAFLGIIKPDGSAAVARVD